jgi:hypothetical protein
MKPCHWIVSPLLLALALAALPLLASAQVGGRPVLVELIPPGPITTDGSDQVLTFVVTDTTGKLAEEAKFRGSTVDFGKLTDWVRTAPGVFSCTFTAPDNSQMSQVRLSLKVQVEKEVVRKELILDMEPPPLKTLTLVADPPVLVRQQDRSVNLEIVARATDGGPTDGLDLVFETNVGSVDRVATDGNGIYRARYLAPEGKPRPDMALLSVTAADQPESIAAFTAIPLVGSVTWEVDTGMSGVPVSLDVGGRRFGPVPADDKGIAGVPILVPPGVESAVATVELGDGNPITQPINLKVPPYRQLAVAPVATHLPGDGLTPVPFYLYVVDRAGEPVSNASLQVQVGLGTLTEPKHKRDGLYVTQYTPPVVHEATPMTFTAAIPGQDESVSTLEFEVVPPLAAGFTATADPAVVAGGDASVKLAANVVALGGTQAEELSAAFFATDGELPDTAGMGMGQFLNGFSGNFDEPRIFLATATQRAIDQPVDALMVWVVDEQVPTEGTTTVVAMTVDRYGLPVSGVPVAARSLFGGGDVKGGGASDDLGRVIFEFQAAPLGGLAVVEVSSGDLTFATPIWQAPGDLPRFVFPRTGGKSRLVTLDRWLPLSGRLLLGAGVVEEEEEAAAGEGG